MQPKVKHMDTLVLLRCMLTNSSKARVSIGPSQCDIKKAIESRVSLSLRRPAFGVSYSSAAEEVSVWKRNKLIYASA
jgi:hypothetical protein